MQLFAAILAGVNVLPGVVIGIVVATAIVQVFLPRPAKTDGGRPLKLAIITLLADPLVGAGLAWLTILLGNVHPLDRTWTFQVFASIGAIAGTIAAAIIGMITAIESR